MEGGPVLHAEMNGRACYCCLSVSMSSEIGGKKGWWYGITANVVRCGMHAWQVIDISSDLHSCREELSSAWYFFIGMLSESVQSLAE